MTRVRIMYCGQCCDVAEAVAWEAKRAILRAGHDIYFKSGKLWRTGRDGKPYPLTAVAIKSLLSEVAEFYCERNGRRRITDVPRPVITLLMRRTIGMRLFREELS